MNPMLPYSAPHWVQSLLSRAHGRSRSWSSMTARTRECCSSCARRGKAQARMLPHCPTHLENSIRRGTLRLGCEEATKFLRLHEHEVTRRMHEQQLACSLARPLAEAIPEMDVRCVPADARKNRRREDGSARLRARAGPARSARSTRAPAWAKGTLATYCAHSLLRDVISMRGVLSSRPDMTGEKSLPMHLIEDGSRSTLTTQRCSR